jgi:hypothetical protein
MGDPGAGGPPPGPMPISPTDAGQMPFKQQIATNPNDGQMPPVPKPNKWDKVRQRIKEFGFKHHLKKHKKLMHPIENPDSLDM